MLESEFLDLSPRERDALVAEKVMGLTPPDEELCCQPVYFANGEGRCGGCSSILYQYRPYTTDIAAAWKVVEHLRVQGIYMRISNVTGRGKYRVATEGQITGFQAEAPLAICIAALKARGVIE